MTMTRKPLSNNQRQILHRNRMRKMGLKSVTCWIHPEDRNALHSYAELLCEKRGIDKTFKKEATTENA